MPFKFVRDADAAAQPFETLNQFKSARQPAA
jgi:hypothetical protein